MRYSPTVIHVAGKEQITADALSRAPASTPKKTDINFLEHIAAHAKQSIEILPASFQKLEEIKMLQKADAETTQVSE